MQYICSQAVFFAQFHVCTFMFLFFRLSPFVSTKGFFYCLKINLFVNWLFTTFVKNKSMEEEKIEGSNLVRVQNSIIDIVKKEILGTDETIGKFIGDAVMAKVDGKASLAIDILRANMKDKTEGSYYYSWQANIAMAYIDNENWYRNRIGKKTLNQKEKHEVANLAAKYFLDMLLFRKQ